MRWEGQKLRKQYSEPWQREKTQSLRQPCRDIKSASVMHWLDKRMEVVFHKVSSPGTLLILWTIPASCYISETAWYKT